MIIVVPGATPVEETPTPEAIAPVRVPPRRRVTYTWTGTDGQVWDITDGPVRLAAGASGFGITTPTHWLNESPGVDGAQWQGMHVGPKDIFLPVHVHGGTSENMLDLERAFFAGLNPRLEGTLRATAPDATWREIRARYKEGAEGEYDLDPILMGYAPYPLRLLACDPYWGGPEVSVTFPFVEPAQFFPGPPFTLLPNSTLDTASVDNPGDEDAFPVWVISGPCTSFRVGVGTAVVAATITLLAGQSVTIDMDPRRLTVTDQAGADRWSTLTDATFDPIPPGVGVPLVTEISGATSSSSVELRFTPRYRRAW